MRYDSKYLHCLVLIAIALICGNLSLDAEIVQIGNGSLYNLALPVEPIAFFSYSQSVYSQAEIGMAGVITQIGWQYRINSTIFLDYTNQFSIYMGTSSRTGYANATDWVSADSLTLVFSGALSAAWFTTPLPGQGWLYIPLQTPYNYSGNGNLVIAVDENMAGNSSTGDDFVCHSVPAPRSIEFHSLTINPDVTSPPAANAGNPLSVRPNIKIDIAPVIFAPYAPTPADGALDVPLNTALSWQSMAQSWDVWFAPEGQTLVQVATGLSVPTWTPATALQLYHSYVWRVTAHAGDVVYEGNAWHFTTVGETLTAPQNLSALCIGANVRLDWSPPSQGSVMSYRIFRNETMIEECQSLQFTDTSVVANQTYFYFVKAVNHLNQVSPASNTASVTVYNNDVYLQQGWETAADFSSSVTDWMIRDIDGAPTWQWDETDFANEGNPLGWIVFNPAQTIPPVSSVLPHSGNKMLLSMAALNPPNNDWLISPPLQIQNGFELSFQARSYTADFGLERLRLLVSTTDSLLTAFTPLSNEPWLPIAAQWTEYNWDLSAYAGQRIYLGWQCVSWDAKALCLDEISIRQTVSNQDAISVVRPDFRIFPNPAREWFAIHPPAKAPFDISICNTKGQRLYQQCRVSTFEWNKGSGVKLPSGVYIIHMEQGRQSTSRKVVVY